MWWMILACLNSLPCLFRRSYRTRNVDKVSCLRKQRGGPVRAWTRVLPQDDKPDAITNTPCSPHIRFTVDYFFTVDPPPSCSVTHVYFAYAGWNIEIASPSSVCQSVRPTILWSASRAGIFWELFLVCLFVYVSFCFFPENKFKTYLRT